MTKPYQTAIIGCGRIGTGFDAPATPEILTHAKAFMHSPATVLGGVCDLDAGLAAAAGRKWGCPAYDSFERMMDELKPELVSICVPDRYHGDYLSRLAAYPVRAVICEKPLTFSLDEAAGITALYREKRIPLTVNFSRRFDTYMRQLKHDVRQGVFGTVLNARITYTKGILHNGSHAVNLALFLFGEFIGGRVLSARTDYCEQDRTLNAYLSFEHCRDLFLIAGDERHCSVFEVDIMGEKRRIRITGNGLYYAEEVVAADPLYDGYLEFHPGDRGETALSGALPVMVANVIDCIEHGAELYSSAEDALLTQKICCRLEEESARLD